MRSSVRLLPLLVLAPLLVLVLPPPASAGPPANAMNRVPTSERQAPSPWSYTRLARTSPAAGAGSPGSSSRPHFLPADVDFAVIETRTLPAAFTTVETIRERIRLRRHLVSRVINICLVDRILDPHPSESTRRAARRMGREPSGLLAGAHILAPGHKPGTFILVSRHSSPLTLTHELGHFFWLPHHRDPANIMSYGEKRQELDKRQTRALRWMARRYRRRAWVRVVRGLGDRRAW